MPRSLPAVPAPPILFCSHVVDIGGAEAVLLDLLQALDRERFTPHLACPGPGALASRAAGAGVAVHHVPIGGRTPWQKAATLPRAARGLRRLAAGLDCRVLVATSMIAGYAAVLAQHRALRCLWHLHIVTRSRLARFALRRAATIVAPSHAGASALAIDGARPRVCVIQNGIADRFFTATGSGLRQRLGVAPATPLLGIVGRLDPHKGHDVLLAAFGRITTTPPPHLVVAGGEAFADSQARIGGYAERLRASAAAAGLAGRVHLLGAIDDTAPLFADLDVVVVPSIALESAPRAVAEAQAAGRAVVASAVGGTPELITDGVTGLLVPPGDANALAAALTALLAEPGRRDRLGAAARSWADSNYRMAAFAQRFADAIGHTLATAR